MAIVYHRRFPIRFDALPSLAGHARAVRAAHFLRMTSSASSDTALRPLPIDTLVVPATLDGRTGTNRSGSAHPQIAATNDLDAVRAWLARFVDTPTTFQNYRKEAERLLLWAVIACGKPLSSLTHEDLVVYRQSCSRPRRPSCGARTAAASIRATIRAGDRSTGRCQPPASGRRW